MYSLSGKKIWVAGHNGMVGAALARRLAREECEILTAGRDALDLRRQAETGDWLAEHRPDAVIVAAAKVGGIGANAASPADFLYDNLAIETNIIHGAHKAGVEKLLFLGSSCIYPRLAPQPIPEDALLTGPLEPTNEWYAIAKIAGIKLCQAYRRQYGRDFISAMPCNLYGPGDRFDAHVSHVIPALFLKLRDAIETGAPEIELWGTGKPLREFLYVDDLADGLVFLLRQYSDEPHINIGSGTEISIADLAALMAEIAGWRGSFAFDPTKPDGTPRKFMNSARLSALGWRPETSLRDGLTATWEWLKTSHPAFFRAA